MYLKDKLVIRSQDNIFLILQHITKGFVDDNDVCVIALVMTSLL